MKTAKMLQGLKAAMIQTDVPQIAKAFNQARENGWTLAQVSRHLTSAKLVAVAEATHAHVPFAAPKPATGARLAPWMQGPRAAK